MKSLKFFGLGVATTLPTGAWRLVLLLATAVSLIGYPKPASAATFNVTVGVHIPLAGLVFVPLSVTIHPGDQVKWTWNSSGHSTTSGRPGMPNGIWDSGVRNQGATFTHTFNSVGTFPYYCTQGGETGQVLVMSATPTPTPAATAQVADFNGDGHPDWVLRNAGTSQTAIWYMNNNIFSSGAYGPTLAAGWGLSGAADFNSDGHPDYALFNSTTRQTAIWYLSGPTLTGTAYGPPVTTGWALVATADFNGDGKPDYLLYNAGTRQTGIWYMNNNVFSSGAYGPTLPAGWSLVGE
jgi:plastocyanin